MRTGSGIRNQLSQHFVGTFSLVMLFSHESEHAKLMTSLIINVPLARFYGQSLICEVIYKSQVDLNSSNSNYFPLCPPWLISVSKLIFSVLIWPLQSFHTVCFQILAAPVVWSLLDIAVLRPPSLVSIILSFFKASSSSSRVWIQPLQSSSSPMA